MANTELMENFPRFLTTSFAAIGFLYISSKALGYAWLLLDLFVFNGTSLRKYGEKGTWAVVTGASDGIGKEFALQLAQKGFNLILVSRTKSKLQSLSQEIESKYAGMQIKTNIVTMDFAQDDDDGYGKLKALVDALDVGILINNVGQSHSIPVAFVDTPKNEIKDIITVNCLSTLKVTQIVAPRLIQRRKGLILTMGSMGGTLPTPLLATYSGSKAFLQQWSTALGAELAPLGVDVELVVAYLITSSMSKIRKTSALIPSPRKYVRDTLSKIGLSGGAQNRAYTNNPFWSHALIHWWLENTVGLMNKLVARYNLKMHEDIRKRAIKKAEREAKKSS